MNVKVIGEYRRIDLRSDGEGQWRETANPPRPDLDGAIDVERSVTPFTNTLPIRRLGLLAGHSGEIRVVDISSPSSL